MELKYLFIFTLQIMKVWQNYYDIAIFQCIFKFVIHEQR